MFKITYVTKILFLLGSAGIEGKSARDQEKAFWRGSDLCPMQWEGTDHTRACLREEFQLVQRSWSGKSLDV